MKGMEFVLHVHHVMGEGSKQTVVVSECFFFVVSDGWQINSDGFRVLRGGGFSTVLFLFSFAAKGEGGCIICSA